MNSQEELPEIQAKHELLRALYAKFNARETDAVLAMLDPDVDWPNGMEGGRIYGREEVRGYWQRQWGMLDPNVVPTRLTEDGAGRTVVDVHQVVRELTGKVLVDQMIRHIYIIRGGLVQSMEICKLDAASGD
jgi:SnoaL-like protein